jgi:cysteine desulfurase/selenocysteine lyase
MEVMKNKFPALTQSFQDQELIYLDSAATTLKPLSVINELTHAYSYDTANVHRGSHFLGDRATEKFEASRLALSRFINSKSCNEIIFTSGTTDGINLVANSYVEPYLQAGDEILISMMEHHSNIVPWQQVALKKQLLINYVNLTPTGELDFADFEKKLSKKTKFVAITHCSNALGTVNDINRIVKLAHNAGAKVLIDAAQSVSFMKIDVQKIDCDFLVFSMHKIYGPYGVGILYGKEDLLNSMHPYRTGGSMIDRVLMESTTFLKAPHRFEAGTPNIPGVIASKAAIDFIEAIGVNNIYEHEKKLLQTFIRQFKMLEGLQQVGESESRVNLFSFTAPGIHNSDIGQLLNQQGVAVRTGHHCTQPLMKSLNIMGTVRVSLGIYNTENDVKRFFDALNKTMEMLR